MKLFSTRLLSPVDEKVSIEHNVSPKAFRSCQPRLNFIGVKAEKRYGRKLPKIVKGKF